jgi:ABC-type Fe3+ transport system permease subunit
MENFLQSLPSAAKYILGGFLVVFLLFLIRGRFRKKEDQPERGAISLLDIVDSPNIHRFALWIAICFALGLAGFVVSGIVKRF